LKTNSATSIESTFKPWHFFVLAGFIAATAGVLLARQTSPGHLVLLSISILCAALTAAGLHRTIAPLAAPHTFEHAESLGRRTRAALEREKALVLRSIKELEFDRAMGKVSDRDFQEMAGRLKARAIELIKRLDQDAGGYRELIEREVALRLEAMGPERPDQPGPAKAGRYRECADCGTANDLDARFCKQCGANLT
jgi:hypothetical protein